MYLDTQSYNVTFRRYSDRLVYKYRYGNIPCGGMHEPSEQAVRCVEVRASVPRTVYVRMSPYRAANSRFSRCLQRPVYPPVMFPRSKGKGRVGEEK